MQVWKSYKAGESNLALGKKKNLESGASPGQKSTEEHIEREQCSRVHLDAITSDDDGSIYAFRGEFPIDISSRQHYSDEDFFSRTLSGYIVTPVFGVYKSMNYLKRYLQK